MNILVFGAQGSGKSTYARYIAEKLGLPYVCTGDLFRKLAGGDSPFGQEIKERLDRGLMVPNPIVIKALKKYLSSLDLSKGIVLDGYPRNFAQARALTLKIDLLIYINLPEELAIKRLLKRGRHDDTPESIKTRLDHYKKETEPLLVFFKEKGTRVAEVDNSPPIKVVEKKIDDLLEKIGRDKNNR
jgi:adenylate kinase